jgi:hypothetical protein
VSSEDAAAVVRRDMGAHPSGRAFRLPDAHVSAVLTLRGTESHRIFGR